MKNKKTNTKKKERAITLKRLFSLFVIFLFLISSLNFVLAENQVTGNVDKKDLEKILREDEKHAEAESQEAVSNIFGPIITLFGLRHKFTKEITQKSKIPITDSLTRPPEKPSTEPIEKDLGDYASGIRKFAFCPLGANAAQAGGWFGCALDFSTWWISFIRGVAMGVSLTNIKGTCEGEEAIKGLNAQQQEEACMSCNEDPLRICTVDRCLVLGNCIPLEPEESEVENIEEMANWICVPGDCEETGLVAITMIESTFYSGGEEILKKTINDDRLIIPGEIVFNADSLKITIETDKLAQCRYSFEPQQEFEDMIDFDDNYFPSMDYLTPEPQEVLITLPGSLARDMQHTIYIKCNNVCGDTHDRTDDNHFVRFKFEKKPDQLPPIIVGTSPDNGAVLSGDITTFTLEFKLDENGRCRYSDNWTLDGQGNEAPLTTEWQEMIDFQSGQHQPNSAVRSGECRRDQECEDLRTDKCTYCYLTLDLRKGFTELSWEQLEPELQQQMELNGTTKFFHYMIRCEDDRNNVMVEEDSMDFVFMTMPPYPIDIIKPELNEATYDVTPEIHITTDERSTNCKYFVKPSPCTETQYPQWDDMLEIDGTFSSEHIGEVEEPLEPAVGGKSYCMYFRCRDQWLLEKKASVPFKILLDKDLPIVIRMYHDVFAGDYLLIETNEDATCVYGADDEIACNYMFQDGNEMTGTNETLHTAYWTLDHLYYIRCKDIWGNVLGKGQCTVILNPFEIPAIPF